MSASKPASFVTISHPTCSVGELCKNTDADSHRAILRRCQGKKHSHLLTKSKVSILWMSRMCVFHQQPSKNWCEYALISQKHCALRPVWKGFNTVHCCQIHFKQITFLDSTQIKIAFSEQKITQSLFHVIHASSSEGHRTHSQDVQTKVKLQEQSYGNYAIMATRIFFGRYSHMESLRFYRCLLLLVLLRLVPTALLVVPPPSTNFVSSKHAILRMTI